MRKDIRRLVVAATVAGACIALPTVAAAEPIYGTLTGPAGPNSTLTVTCGNVTASVQADRSGSYRLNVKARGRCTLRIGDMQQDERIVIYDQPTRYDYEVTKVNGRTQIERR